MRCNPFLKFISVILILILGLWIIQSLMVGPGFGIGFNMRGYYGGDHMYMSPYMGGGTIGYLLLLLIKVLFAVFVIALVAALFVWVKNNLFTTDDFNAIKNSFRPVESNFSTTVCTACGKNLNNEWKVCPHCGKGKEEKNI